MYPQSQAHHQLATAREAPQPLLGRKKDPSTEALARAAAKLMTLPEFARWVMEVAATKFRHRAGDGEQIVVRLPPRLPLRLCLRRRGHGCGRG